MFARQIVIDMKRLLILAGLMMACTFPGFSQEDKKPFIQYHAMSAFGVGYSYIYSPFETTYFGNLPSVGMLYCESNLLGVYLGIGGSSKKTGYNVLGFDESTVFLVTSCGRLTLEGNELHITVLNLTDGVVEITGKFYGFFYEDTLSDRERTDKHKGKRGFFGRLFS